VNRAPASPRHRAVRECRLASRNTLSDALRSDRLAAGDLVLVAVSGGPDSLALLATAVGVAPSLGLRVGAISVDHGLQEGSAERAAAVVECCRALGAEPAEQVGVAVGTTGGLEAAARAARYDALAAAGHRRGAAAVLTGHTLDDQAETVLLGLARGSGARSLSGMAPYAVVHGVPVLRPLLGVRRAVTRAACVALGLQPWDDPHNGDRRFARVRARADALPALEAALGPGMVEALARSAALLRDDADALDGWARDVGSAGLDVETLAALPAAVRRRVLRLAAVDAGAPAGSLGAGHLRELERLVVDWRGQSGVSLPGGLVAERRCDRLSFR
jgi:tRNA(Ile)-lysidine synthase